MSNSLRPGTRRELSMCEGRERCGGRKAYVRLCFTVARITEIEKRRHANSSWESTKDGRGAHADWMECGARILGAAGVQQRGGERAIGRRLRGERGRL